MYATSIPAVMRIILYRGQYQSTAVYRDTSVFGARNVSIGQVQVELQAQPPHVFVPFGYVLDQRFDGIAAAAAENGSNNC
ncbi:trichodiene oxygenase [Apiospora arundinis]